MSDTSLRFNFLEGRNSVIPATGKTAAAIAAMDRAVAASGRSTTAQSRARSQELFRIDNAMRSSARRMASHVLLIGGAIAAVSGHAVALTGALWPLIGALGAFPAVSVGVIAGLGALITGFSGLGAAMRKTGGGAGVSAEQIASAERRIERAQRSAVDAQNALNDAREEAADRLRDIQTQYARANLDQKEAALAVRDAELALRQARSSGDRMARQRAELALESARLAQIEVANRLSDVEQEYQRRMAAGVDGSEEVRAAAERQADALYELADAQRALDQAMRGSGGGGEDAYGKLSESGKKLVDTLRSLGPEWKKVQQATQQALFAGLGDDVKLLSERWLPSMMRNLPAIAQGWNNLFRGVTRTASQQGFVNDMDVSLGHMAVMWQRIGNAFAPFLSGFRHWVSVGSQFLPRLGSWVERLAGKFELWSLRVRTTGEAFNWIENAIQTGHKWNELLKSWGRSLFEVFRLGQDKSLLNNLIAGSRAFEKWLSTAGGQERITQMWAHAREVGSALWRVMKSGLDILSQFDVAPLAILFGALADALGFVSKHMGLVNVVVGPLVLAMVGLKVATIAAALALKTYNLALGVTPAKAAAASTAMKGFMATLGPIALGIAAVWTAFDYWPEGKNWETAAQLIGGFGYMLHDSMTTTKLLKPVTDEHNAAIGVTADEYARASQELQTWSDLLKAETDPVWAFIQAQEQVAQAQERVNEAQAMYGAGSPQHTQAVRDLQQAMMRLNDASLEAATVDETLLIPQLQEMERQGLLAAGSAQAIADALAASKRRADELNGTRVKITVDQIFSKQVLTYGQSYGMATFSKLHDGGIVPGPRGQEVAAILQRGEMVTPYEEVQKQMKGGGSGSGEMDVHVYVHADADSWVKVGRTEVRKRGGLARTFPALA